MTDAFLQPADLLAQARDHLARYLRACPAESTGLQALAGQLAHDTGDVFSRANMRGHITTSGLVYDARADAVLMIHHKALGRWLQPGGHHEGLDRLEVSAAREVVEETGVSDLSPWPAGPGLPFDIDTHRIPANPAKGEGEHVHHDFIYLFAADAAGEVRPQWAEVSGSQWMPRPDFAALPEARFARLGAKLLALR